MLIDIGNFGNVLISHPAGKDAFLFAKSYVLNELHDSEMIKLDFGNVKVLTPSWADEFISGIRDNYQNTIKFINTQNESVSSSLKTLYRSFDKRDYLK